MLIKKDLTDKVKSIYKCDMCNSNINQTNLNKIEVIKPYYRKSKKYWDLCDRCLNTLTKSIKKYNKTRKENQ